jgi:hypothetical protein
MFLFWMVQYIYRLLLGIAADWLGWRKPFILIGLGLDGPGAWIMGTADTVNSLTIGRVVTGL